jgi:hypothetical protein
MVLELVNIVGQAYTSRHVSPFLIPKVMVPHFLMVNPKFALANPYLMLVKFWFSLANLRNLFQKNCVHSSSTVVLCLKRGVMTFGVLLPLPCAELEVGIWWDVVIQELFKSHSFGMNKNQTTFGFSQKWVFARMGLLAIIGDISWDIYISYIAKILKLMIFFVV